jgi:hypothetical protein
MFYLILLKVINDGFITLIQVVNDKHTTTKLQALLVVQKYVHKL